MMGWLSVAASGCAAGNPTLIQEELRAKEAAVRDCEQQLQTAQFQLQATQRENQALRAQLEGAGVEALSAEYAAAMFTVKEMAVHPLSGGIDTDGFEGDDALLVFLQPLDNEGDLRKAPGKVTLELMDMALEEPQRRIGYWEFGPQETHSHWYSGFLMSGYRFELPWQQGYPRHTELTLHARFETPDGRVFAKTREIEIQLLPGQAAETQAEAAPGPKLFPEQPEGKSARPEQRREAQRDAAQATRGIDPRLQSEAEAGERRSD